MPQITTKNKRFLALNNLPNLNLFVPKQETNNSKKQKLSTIESRIDKFWKRKTNAMVQMKNGTHKVNTYH